MYCCLPIGSIVDHELRTAVITNHKLLAKGYSSWLATSRAIASDVPMPASDPQLDTQRDQAVFDPTPREFLAAMNCIKLTNFSPERESNDWELPQVSRYWYLRLMTAAAMR